MRISDWSSDVCSSDLDPEPGDRIAGPGIGAITDDQQIGGEARDSIERGRQRGAECVTRGALRQRQVERGAVAGALAVLVGMAPRSEEHTSELQSLMRISYAVFCLKKKNQHQPQTKIQPNKYKEPHTTYTH